MPLIARSSSSSTSCCPPPPPLCSCSHVASFASARSRQQWWQLWRHSSGCVKPASERFASCGSTCPAAHGQCCPSLERRHWGTGGPHTHRKHRLSALRGGWDPDPALQHLLPHPQTGRGKPASPPRMASSRLRLTCPHFKLLKAQNAVYRCQVQVQVCGTCRLAFVPPPYLEDEGLHWGRPRALCHLASSSSLLLHARGCPSLGGCLGTSHPAPLAHYWLNRNTVNNFKESLTYGNRTVSLLTPHKLIKNCSAILRLLLHFSLLAKAFQTFSISGPGTSSPYCMETYALSYIKKLWAFSLTWLKKLTSKSNSRKVISQQVDCCIGVYQNLK